jgi:hypothetical protein
VSQLRIKELQFQVFIGEPPSEQREWVGFESPGSSPEYTFSTLAGFHQSLISGQALPLTLVTKKFDNSFGDISKLVAMVMYLHRDVAIRPALTSLVSSSVIVSQLGWVGLAHIDRDLAWFFEIMRSWIWHDADSRREEGNRITSAIRWLRDWVGEGKLPTLPPEQSPPRVISVGTNGFVLAEAPWDSNLRIGWVELFREGHLKGALVTEPSHDLRRVLVAKRSDHISFDLGLAQSILNQAEGAMGGSEWPLDGTCWLHSPGETLDGTLLPVSSIVDVLVRV